MVDYVTQTAQAIVAKLAASNYWPTKVKMAGFNAQTYLSGIRWPTLPPTSGASDRPAFTMEVDTVRTTPAGRNLMPTFCNVRGNSGDVVVQQDVVYKITITHAGLDLNVPNALLAEFNALTLADPRLGLAKVKTSGAATARYQRIGKTKNELQQTISFPVSFELHRADLQPA
jgi:hypothetical protein